MQAMKKAKAEAEAKAAAMAADAKARAVGALPPAVSQQVAPSSAPAAVAAPLAPSAAAAAPPALAPVPVAEQPKSGGLLSGIKAKADGAVQVRNSFAFSVCGFRELRAEL